MIGHLGWTISWCVSRDCADSCAPVTVAPMQRSSKISEKDVCASNEDIGRFNVLVSDLIVVEVEDGTRQTAIESTNTDLPLASIHLTN